MLFLILATVAQLIGLSVQHGRMIEPPARNAMWRVGYPTPPNFEDSELFCGGIAVSSFLFWIHCLYWKFPFNFRFFKIRAGESWGWQIVILYRGDTGFFLASSIKYVKLFIHFKYFSKQSIQWTTQVSHSTLNRLILSNVEYPFVFVVATFKRQFC